MSTRRDNRYGSFPRFTFGSRESSVIQLMVATSTGPYASLVQEGLIHVPAATDLESAAIARPVRDLTIVYAARAGSVAQL